MEKYQDPEGHVKQMRPIEYFETAATPHKRLRTDEHNAEHDRQSDTRWIRAAAAKTK